jgi:hypothetical protein
MWTATTCPAFFPVSNSHADPVKMPAINVEIHEIAAQPESCSLSSRMSSETLNFCLFFITSLWYNVGTNNTNGQEWQHTTGLELCIPSTSKLCIYDIWYIFNCNWVYTWWQYSTHLHTNNTQTTQLTQTIHTTKQFTN